MPDVAIGLYTDEELEDMAAQDAEWRRQRATQCDEVLKIVAEENTVRPFPTEGGQHKDAGKRRYDLIPQVALDAEADVMTYGAAKYGRDNYQRGIRISRLVASLLRHVYDFKAKKDTDKESGLPALAHARCCIGMIMDTLVRHPELDDR
jgi:hypothetical protein